MAEPDALLVELEEIARNPGDDTPRWRAATRYEERGDRERARFIRLQLQLARLPDDVDSPEWLPIIEESQRLLRQHYEAWTAPYADLDLADPDFDRGFIEKAGVEARRLLQSEYRHELFRRLPLCHLDITSLNRASVREVLKVPEIDSMVSLGFDRLSLSDDDVSAFGERYLPRLRWLSLTRNHLTIEGARQLARISKERLPSLEFVDLAGNPYDPMDEIEYDQHVALAWRRGGEETDVLYQASWLPPRIVDGRVEPHDRMMLGRPAVTEAEG